MNSPLNSTFKGPRVVTSTSVSTTPFTIDDTTSEALSVDATGGARVVNLPAISASLGKSYTIRKIDASVNTVTITRAGSDLIEGATTIVLTTQWQSVTVDNDGIQWHRTGTNSSSGGSGTAAGGTGAVQFANGTTLAADATKLFWDNTNKRLGVGTNTPAYTLDVVGHVASSGELIAASHVTAGSLVFLSANNATPTGHSVLIDTTNVISTCRRFNIGSQVASGSISNAFGAASVIWSGTLNASGPTAYDLYIGAHAHDGSTGADPTKLMVFKAASPWNVGIGTASPSQRLHVVGTIYSSSGGFRFPDNTTQTTAAVSGGTAAGSAGAVQFSNGASVFVADSSNFVWDDTNNKLGVGRSPVTTGATLQVGNGDLGGSGYLNAADRMLAVSASAGITYIAAGQDATRMVLMGWAYNATPANAYGTIGTYGYTNNLLIDALNIGLQTLNSGGKVGIGTAAPAAALHASTAPDNSGLRHQASTFGTFNTYIDANGVSVGTSSNHRLRLVVGGVASEKASIETNGNFIVDTNVLFVDAVNNRVGIGTATPLFPVHVIGSDLRMESPAIPRFSFNYSAGGTDQKKWQFYGGVLSCRFSALNDAENAENVFFDVTRGTGTAISSVNFPHRVGIGTFSAGSGNVMAANVKVQVINELGATDHNMWVDAYSTAGGTAPAGSGIIMRAARGTPAVPVALSSGDEIGGVFGRGYGTVFSTGNRVGIAFHTAQTFTATAHGTEMRFSTTLNGTTTLVERMKIANTGDVSFDTSTLYVDAVNDRVGIGTASPTQTLNVSGNSLTTGTVWNADKLVVGANASFTPTFGLTVFNNLSDDASMRLQNSAADGYSEMSLFNSSGSNVGGIGYANTGVGNAEIAGRNYFYCDPAGAILLGSELASGILIEGSNANSISIHSPVTYDGNDSITAFAGGGQASATVITAELNFVTTVATPGDSVKLPVAALGKRVVIYNESANAVDIFPFLGGTINGLAANAAYSLAGNTSITLWGRTATNWKTY